MKTRFTFITLILAILFANAYGQSSPTESQARAIRMYPDLAQKDSAFNQAFVKLYERRKAEGDPVLQKPNWPILLATEVASSLGIEPTVTKAEHKAVAPAEDDESFAQRQLLERAQFETSQKKFELSGETEEAEWRKISFTYKQKIEKARHYGNDAIADEYVKQQELERLRRDKEWYEENDKRNKQRDEEMLKRNMEYLDRRYRR